MRYAITVDVSTPRELLVTLVDDPLVLPTWHDDLLRLEPLEGQPGIVGARTRLVYDVAGREVEVVEQVVESTLPESFVTLTCAAGSCAEIRHEFEALGDRATRWTQHASYSLTGPGLATFGAVMPGALPRRTRAQMLTLKRHAEALWRDHA